MKLNIVMIEEDVPDRIPPMNPPKRQKTLTEFVHPKTIVGGKIKRGKYRIPVANISNYESHVKELTFKPKVTSEFAGGEQLVTAAMVEEGHLVVPRCYGLKHFGGTDIPPETGDGRLLFKGELSKERQQPEAVEASMAMFENPRQRGCTLCLPCGYGKTVTALYLAAKLQGKVLVLCHKTYLVNQWLERISEYLPGATVGKIQGPTCNTDADIVVGMLQSIYSHDYSEESLSGYTLLIVDEAHHVPAQTFFNAVGKISTVYSLALTATPERKDGLTPLLFAVMGDIAFSINRKPVTDGEVFSKKVNYSRYIKETPIRKGGSANLSKLITELAMDPERTSSVVQDIVEALSDKENQRYIIVLSDRIDQLLKIKESLESLDLECLGEDVYGGVRMLVGSTKEKDRETAVKARVVLTSFPFSQEGVDQPRLDTLVLATPKGDITQSIGRILRQHPDKSSPRVYDYYDTVDSGVVKGLYAKRKKILTQHGFTWRKKLDTIE